VAVHPRGCPDSELATGAGSVPAGGPARNQSRDRFCDVGQWCRIFAFDSVMLKQLHIKFDVAVDRVDRADTIKIQHLILPILVMVNVAERDLWQDRPLGTEGVVSHELPFQSSKFPNKEIHSRLSTNNLVPDAAPRNICGCIYKDDVDVDAI